MAIINEIFLYYIILELQIRHEKEDPVYWRVVESDDDDA
jgi:hypothetical protein